MIILDYLLTYVECASIIQINMNGAVYSEEKGRQIDRWDINE